jgi:AraC family transcriptional regulator
MAKRLAIGEIGVTERSYPPHLRMARHAHEHAYLTLVVGGGYEERIGAESREVGPSAVLLHPQDEEHAVRFGPRGARIVNVVLGHRLSERLRDLGLPLSAERWRPNDETPWLVARLRREFAVADAASMLAIEGIVMELLASGLRGRERSAPSRMEEAREYLRAHAAGSVTLESAADANGIHPVYLSRSFRQAFGCTVGEYLRDCRLQRALRMIGQTELTLGEIAAECGFADQAHLTRLFRARTGMTPSAYRRTG